MAPFLIEIRLREVSVYEVPVYQSPERFQVVWTYVAVIDVVSVFPQVNSQQRSLTFSQRAASVASVNDIDRTVSIFNQPSPARTEVIYRFVI